MQQHLSCTIISVDSAINKGNPMLQLPDSVSIYPDSIVEKNNSVFFLAFHNEKKYLGMVQDAGSFTDTECVGTGCWLAPLNSINLSILQEHLPWLKPISLGLVPSFGFGDRLGFATPGHVKSVLGRGIAPLFAQQSVRENARTGRTPQQVLEDAAWGVFQSGWKDAWGADADHLKTVADIPPFINAGYSFYTIDPGAFVDDRAGTLSGGDLEFSYRSLPWDRLENSPDDLKRSLLGQHLLPGDYSLHFSEISLAQAAVKYGRAVAHALDMSNALTSQIDGQFDLEISLDETSYPTSAQEHYYVASELRRLGIDWVSLAPRFVGRFEKGVDYIGNITDFAVDLRWHAAVADHFGSYRLSLHSGSDKFSIYPALAEITRNKVHVKTAGTSYLEALRVIAAVQPAFFYDICHMASQHYSEDRASYHVSAEVNQMPKIESSRIDPGILDHFHVRQALHVTFGTILACYGEDLRQFLTINEALYLQTILQHFDKHLDPFCA
jgi:tagaturonate epimerase